MKQLGAWCWQQGSRLRWSNNDKNIVFYNDVDKENYCFKKYDISNNTLIDTVPFPIYDINKEETFGISLNFSRLQRLRPGYGYDAIEDYTKDDKAPRDDGLFLVDLKNKTKKLLVSLFDLAMLVDKELEFEHYLNHISISPEGNKIMFFHLWTDKRWMGWRTQLCVINSDGSDLKILEDEDIVSHYNWKDENTLLITGIKNPSKENFYRLYYLDENTKKDIQNEHLRRDGHPSFEKTKKVFYSDTYPNKKHMQSVFEYDVNENKCEQLLQVFSDPRLVYEKRCDLHPKLSSNNRIIVDSTYKGCKRSVIIINLDNYKRQ